MHDKMLNFMTPMQNLEVVEGRNALVENLFGVKKANETILAGRKRKASKKKITIGNDDDEDDIALI